MPSTERAMIEEYRERYINPYTDFGFKKLFGQAENELSRRIRRNMKSHKPS